MISMETKPQTILYNGTVATQNPDQPFANAVALGAGRIMALGADDEIRQLAGPHTETIDLKGRLAAPGFIDPHIHFYEWALQRQGLKLDSLHNLDELLALVRQKARNIPPGQWIMGQGWNETDWQEPRMPTRESLDLAAPDHPVLLWRCDLHLAAANTAALRLAGIGPNTPDPPEGRIEKDQSGEPTGILRELAINLAREAVAPPDAAQIREAFVDAARALHRRGVTGIHDTRLMADEDGGSAFRAFQDLEHQKRLQLRTWVTMPGHHLDDIVRLGLRTGFGSDKLRIGHVKFFSDGGMGARTAWMVDPYLDAERGMPLMEMELLERQIRQADQAGLSVMVHAVGDRANRELINIFEALEMDHAKTGSQPPLIPHRIEHVQMIRPEDVQRLKKLHLALCVTPANLLLDINLIDSVVGEKGKWAYAFRTLFDTGSPVMFSSDCPVCNPDPLVGIRAAVLRQRADGSPHGGWHPQNRVTASEALGAYTAAPAHVLQAADLGMIAPGKKADLVVLSQDILNSPPAKLNEARVDMTFFEGRMVYRRD